MVGQTLGHYRILEQIGAGGMGVVYRAHDERLDRDVALKVLPAGALSDEAARKRFRKEAIALSKLNHPNIATIHDFDTQDGTDFLVMEYIPGVTLTDRVSGGPLPEKEIARLGVQLAEGLSAAHEQSVIHRDLKPGNLRIMPDGRLKILDFGLAKLVHPLSETDLTASGSETHAVAGTLPYMAPEQLQGAALDARTDIYAAGVVLYEMATGRPPFQETLSTALADAILHRPAPPPGRLKPDLSQRFEEIILKCMEKEPDNRFQSAKEMLVDLRRVTSTEVMSRAPERAYFSKRRVGLAWIAAAVVLLLAAASYFAGNRFRSAAKPPAGKIMLVVLPFENLSADPEQEYFSDGLTEEMISQLGSLQPQRLGVIARTSAMKYKKTEKSVDQIGRELNVAYVLEGSVRKAGTRVRVTAQLIQVSDQTHLWAENYEKELADVLSVQSEVAQRIAKSLELELLPEKQARLATSRAMNPEAHEAYLKGRFYWNRRSKEGLEKGIEYFQRAASLDPNYALAYAGLGDSYVLLPFYANVAPAEAFPRAKQAATKAMEIDERVGEAHTALAYAKLLYDWDWRGAEKGLQRAIELNPGYATAHQWYADYLTIVGRHEEAVSEMQRARECDPLSLIVNANVGEVRYFARQYDGAIEELRRALELDPNFAEAHQSFGWAYEQKGMYPEAVREYQALADPQRRRLSVGRAFAKSGKRNEARAILDEIVREAERRYVPAYFVATTYLALGEKDKTFAWLEKAWEERDIRLAWVKVDPAFDPVRSDRRFQDLLRRMNFPK